MHCERSGIFPQQCTSCWTRRLLHTVHQRWEGREMQMRAPYHQNYWLRVFFFRMFLMALVLMNHSMKVNQLTCSLHYNEEIWKIEYNLVAKRLGAGSIHCWILWRSTDLWVEVDFCPLKISLCSLVFHAHQKLMFELSICIDLLDCTAFETQIIQFLEKAIMKGHKVHDHLWFSLICEVTVLS